MRRTAGGLGLALEAMSLLSNKIILSIVVPAYDADSYLDQFFDNLLIVDKTWKLLNYSVEVIFVGYDLFKTQHKQIRSFLNLQFRVINVRCALTPSIARNIGLRASRGRYIFFPDIDDFINPSFTNFIGDHLTSEDYLPTDILLYKYWKSRSGKYEVIDHGIDFSRETLTLEDIEKYLVEYTRLPHLRTAFVHIWSKIYSRSFITLNNIIFSQTLEQLEDVKFNFDCLSRKPRIRTLNHFIYAHTIHPPSGGNLSAKSGESPSLVLRQVYSAYTAVENVLRICGQRAQTAKLLRRRLQATTIILFVIRSIKRQSSCRLKYKSVVEYCSNRRIRLFLKLYSHERGTVWLLPKLITLNLPLLAIATYLCSQAFVRFVSFAINLPRSLCLREGPMTQ